MYMSPEQTGRMNRVVDYRSDFYSLGILSLHPLLLPSHIIQGMTFYELLSGSPPFLHLDIHTYSDLVYKHLAVYPKSIIEVYKQMERTFILLFILFLDKAASWICTRECSC
jgi:serine/threonine protein kinase